MGTGEKRTYFNQLATRWDSIPKVPHQMDGVASFCRRGCRRPAKTVLDAGSGTGLLAPCLLADSDLQRLVELDFALEMLRASARQHRDRRITRVCGDILALPFPAGTFDAVLCYGILPHLPDREAGLGELWRVLRPRGTLAVGHPLGSARLNELHANLDGPVSGDRLVPAAELARRLRRLGAVALEAEETPEWYFVRAEKGAA